MVLPISTTGTMLASKALAISHDLFARTARGTLFDMPL
jgi:hypothetical protein